MTAMTAERLLSEVIAAHGGETPWRAARAVEAVCSVDGALFAAKRRPVLTRVRMRASATEPRFAFEDFPAPGQRAELVGEKEVRIADASGRTVARREAPRRAFAEFRRNLYWDDLDFVYFGGYAMWNYLTAPFLFLRPGFRFESPEPAQASGADWTRLAVTFPEDLPTHSRRQVFYFDEARMLRRLDYTAEVVSRFAKAAHLCGGHRSFGGLVAPTSRRVRPLGPFGRPLPFPTLVAIDVHDLRLVSG